MEKVVNFLNDIDLHSKVIHISHIDSDGYGSSFIVYKMLQDEVDLIQDNTNYGQIVDTLLDYEIDQDTTVIITDLNLTMEECEHLDSRTKRWMVIDHHSTGKDSAAAYPDNYYLNTKYSATKLTYDIFKETKYLIDDKLDKHLYDVARIVDIYDIWRKDYEREFKMGMLISLYVDRNPFESRRLKLKYNNWIFGRVFEHLIKFGVQTTELDYPDMLMDWIMVQGSDDYLRDDELPTAIKIALLHTSIMEDHRAYSIGEVVIFTGLSTNVTQYTFDKLLDDPEYEDKVLINLNERNGKMSLRSRNEHASYYAKHLGGGGHPNAAGAKLDIEGGSYLTELVNRIEYLGPENNNLKYLISLNILLKKYNISLEQFTTLCKAEKFNEEEVNDLGYMEDKMAIWQEK